MRGKQSCEELKKIANKIRIDTVESIYCAGSGHPGGSLSIVEILSVLYFYKMDVEPGQPDWKERDRFVLSKGHAAPAYYAALAERGYFPVEELKRLRKIDSFLQGHPDRRKVPGVDMSTGSLGQGISEAAGMALYGKLNHKKYHVYAVIGDGEMQEGQVWEALMSAVHFRLSNLTVLLDNNNLQIDGEVSRVMSIYPIREKLEAFGWNVQEADGNDVESLMRELDRVPQKPDAPVIVICRTTKGRGVSYMENQASWHGSVINREAYETAMSELGAPGFAAKTAVREEGGR